MVKHPPNSPQPEAVQAQPAIPSSWEGVQALIPRQAVLMLSQEGVQAVQALIPRQAVLTLSQVGVQPLIPRQAALIPTSLEGMQAAQALFPRQTRL